MVVVWLCLAGFSGFIAWRSFSQGSFVRGSFAGFWLALFLFAIWVDFQGQTAGVA